MHIQAVNSKFILRNRSVLATPMDSFKSRSLCIKSLSYCVYIYCINKYVRFLKGALKVIKHDRYTYDMGTKALSTYANKERHSHITNFPLSFTKLVSAQLL